MYISDAFFDKYIGLVSAHYLTSYLYLLRKRKNTFKASDVCQDLGISTPTLKKILRFWSEQEVLTYDWKETGQFTIKIRTEEKTFHEATYKETKELLESPAFLEVIDLTKTVFPEISVADKAKLGGMWTEYDMTNKDFYVVLLKYCRDHGARHPSYMFTIAKKWYDAGVKTPAAALAWIDGKWGAYCNIRKRYGVGGPPTDPEIAVFEEWKANYSDEQIGNAIDITVMNTGKMSVNYTSAVLRNFKKNAESSPQE